MITQNRIRIVFIIAQFIILTVPFQLCAQNTIADAINKNKVRLYYPQSVKRFYQKTGYKLIWIAPDTVKTHTSDAMLLLDCVVQYGLAHQDYHAELLQYDELHRLIAEPTKTDNARKALYDIYLTDALICFINNLHYGRLNPQWTKVKIDRTNKAAFNAETILLNALTQSNFKSAIISVQPTSKAYQSLQYQMYTVTGLHTGDCYQTPASEIRLMDINMERLRWVNRSPGTYVEINIPSRVLSLYKHNKIYRFKINGMLPQRLPASLNSFTVVNGNVVLNKVTPITISEEVKLQPVNNQIAIPHGLKLAALLVGRGVLIRQNKDFKLSAALPLHFTYYTCEMQQGTLIKYEDVYGLDEKMERELNR